jgi:hypothetical protein
MQYTPAEARPKEGSAAGAKAAAEPMTVAATAVRSISKTNRTKKRETNRNKNSILELKAGGVGECHGCVVSAPHLTTPTPRVCVFYYHSRINVDQSRRLFNLTNFRIFVFPSALALSAIKKNKLYPLPGDCRKSVPFFVPVT